MSDWDGAPVSGAIRRDGRTVDVLWRCRSNRRHLFIEVMSIEGFQETTYTRKAACPMCGGDGEERGASWRGFAAGHGPAPLPAETAAAEMELLV